MKKQACRYENRQTNKKTNNNFLMRKINSYRITRSIRNQELQIIKLKRRKKKTRRIGEKNSTIRRKTSAG